MDLILIAPFILLLLAIGILPFANEKWWNKNYFLVSFIPAVIIIIIYLVFLNGSDKIIIAVEDYISFICLLFSLYVVSGGIYFKIKGKATPLNNLIILAVGSVVANIFGTTGAAMLLIKPYIESNKNRIKSYHIVFFIFLVCNVGGLLTPIGDPPLLIGYIKGIPFFWVTENLFLYWFIAVLYLLIIFFLIDNYFYKKLKSGKQSEVEKKREEIKAGGFINFIPLIIIIGSVFITKPLFVREAIMLICAVISYKTTPDEIHKRNNFNFRPIKEVAILFAGIFITMIPALDYLKLNASSIGLKNPEDFYWASGILTSFLDNAPTYISFLSASMGLTNLSIYNTLDVISFVKTNSNFVIAISISSVFFGAMTYIGNGPNLLVKSISELRGIKLPGFFAYMYKYSLVILLPFYFILWLLFFK